MKNYRLIEIAPLDDKCYRKAQRTTLFIGPDKADLKAAIEDYHKRPRKPWAEIAYYYGTKRIYVYEI